VHHEPFVVAVWRPMCLVVGLTEILRHLRLYLPEGTVVYHRHKDLRLELAQDVLV